MSHRAAFALTIACVCWFASSSAGRFASAQDLAPSLSEERFRQIHYQIFQADQEQPTCVQPPPMSGCAEYPGDRAPLQMPSFDSAASPTSGFLPDSFGATRGTLSAAPMMIGDFFGGGRYFGGDLVSNAGADRAFKLSDNWQPLPTNRVYFNYHHFNSVTTEVAGLTSVNTRDFDRYTLGIEQTLFGGLMSFDFRAPYISGLNSDQVQGAFPSGPVGNGEFSNVGLAAKVLLIGQRRFALSGGLGMTFPTGDDYRLFDSFGTQIDTLENDSVHLQPFLGFVASPGGRLFAQGVIQVDVDVNGSNASYTNLFRGGPAQPTGRIQDQTLLYTGMSLGYWMYQDPSAMVLTGMAPIIELHYTSALQDTDSLNGEFANVFNRQDFLNLTSGLTFAIGEWSYLTLAGAVPLKSYPNRGFDAETGIQYVRRY